MGDGGRRGIQVRFSGNHGEGLRFVEVEDLAWKSIRIGRWNGNVLEITENDFNKEMQNQGFNPRSTPADVLFMFMAWLTVRPSVLRVGANEDASVVPPLIGRFLEANGFEAKPTDGFEESLEHPPEDESDHDPDPNAMTITMRTNETFENAVSMVLLRFIDFFVNDVPDEVSALGYNDRESMKAIAQSFMETLNADLDPGTPWDGMVFHPIADEDERHRLFTAANKGELYTDQVEPPRLDSMTPEWRRYYDAKTQEDVNALWLSDETIFGIKVKRPWQGGDDV